MLARVRVTVCGLVQGVGFRPYIYRLATDHHFTGYVKNIGSGVLIEMQGEAERLACVDALIRHGAPVNSRIDKLSWQAMPVVEQDAGFRIADSSAESMDTIVPADCAICANCLAEFYNPSSRHYLNFFVSCTDCGPRYSMLRFLPYDRPATTMDEFSMCEACLAEYTSPGDRRFHAQSTTCADCGPHYRVYDCQTERHLTFADDEAALDFAARSLMQGKVVALQGVGGYHLLGDPENRQTVRRIKQGKLREGKPLAILVKDVEAVKRFCVWSQEESDWFLSSQSPIVLARLAQNNPFADANDGLNTLGVMRPYTSALHYLLVASGREYLVATSANLSGRPTIINRQEAEAELRHLADSIISHNRVIYRRVDDTVSFISEAPVIIRPGRGIAPLTIPCPGSTPLRMLAVGAEQKTTVALFRENTVTISEYLGDLHTAEYRQAYEDAIERLLALYQFSPELVVHDLNPDYYSTRLAQRLAARFGAQTTAVQHHEAHVVSVMLEHGLSQAIGFAFDGTGYGRDGTIWGGEGFIVEPGQAIKRVFHIEPFPLVSGAKAIEQPDRLLYYFLQELDPQLCQTLFAEDDKLALVYRTFKAMGAPQTSSMGRLFDAAAVLLGCGRANTYEARLAMHLESIADASEAQSYSFTLAQGREAITVSAHEMMNALIADFRKATDCRLLAARFHNTVARLITETAVNLRERSGIKTVVLSGGVFQNRFLLERSKEYLRSKGFTVSHGRFVPMNDSGISAGQIGCCLRAQIRS